MTSHVGRCMFAITPLITSGKMTCVKERIHCLLINATAMSHYPSEDVVMTQIWNAIIAYLLTEYIR